MFSASEILDLAVRIEENGERFYRQALEKITEPSLMVMLRSVADDEVRHREWFLNLKKRGELQKEDRLFKVISGALLQDAVDDHGFSLDTVDFSTIPDEKSLLEVAIGFEQDSIAFYEILGGFVENGDTLKHLVSIIEEEKRHIDLLEERISVLVM